MDDTQLLSEVGQAIYGAEWQSEVCRKICVSERSMSRWIDGTDRIPWCVWFDVCRHLERRALTLDYWKKELYERVVIKECESRPTAKFDSEKDWRVEVRDPLNGRQLKHSSIMQSLAHLQALMKRHPGMIFRVTVPFGATAEERQDFAQMNVARVKT
jgi:hypothetical protein